MKIFGINFSKFEVYLILGFLFMLLIYTISLIPTNKTKVNNKYYCISQICINTEFYTKCYTLDKPHIFEFQKFRNNVNQNSYILYFKDVKKDCPDLRK